MPNPRYAAYEAADPYFDLVRGALRNHKDRKPENRALERLHGLSRGLERIDGARSLKDLEKIKRCRHEANSYD